MVENQANNSAIHCEQVWREISNYVEGDLDPTLRAAMDGHFQACKKCASVLAGTKNVIALYGDERMIEVPAGFSRRLEGRISASVRPARNWWSGWSMWLVPVAALALIAGGLKLVGIRNANQTVETAGYRLPAELKVVVVEGSKEFHVPSCDLIHPGDKLKNLTAKEALKEGLKPCPRCLRKYQETASTGAQPGLAVVLYSGGKETGRLREQ